MYRLLIFTICALFSASNSSSAEMLWGANGHPLTAYPGTSIEQQFEYLNNLGLKAYRINISYPDSIPRLAEIVDKAKGYGIQILPVITPGNVDLENDTTQALYEKAWQFANLAASRFKSEIRTWELGNELENFAIIQPCEMRDDGTQYPCEWGPASGLGASDYYGPRWKKVSAVLKGLSDGIEAVDPGIRKAIGTAGWEHLGAFKRMKDDGIAWDITVWHSYNDNPEDKYAALSKYGKPIWVTEFNNRTGSQKSETDQAEVLDRQMAQLRSYEKYGVEGAFIYELMDEPYLAPSFEADMGLVRLVPTPQGGWRAGEPKPAYFAVRNVIRGRIPPPNPARNCGENPSASLGADYSWNVRYAYCRVLGRLPGPVGAATWNAILQDTQTSFQDMVFELASSEEFRKKYQLQGVSDENYIKFLYLMLLDRAADGGGLAAYANSLASGHMSRNDVARSLIYSAEFSEKHRELLSKKMQPAASTDRPG